MEAPKCKICRQRHYGPCYAIGIATFEESKARTIAIASGKHKPAPSEPKVWITPETATKFDRTTYQRDYMREYMRKRRAAAKEG